MMGHFVNWCSQKLIDRGLTPLTNFGPKSQLDIIEISLGVLKITIDWAKLIHKVRGSPQLIS